MHIKVKWVTLQSKKKYNNIKNSHKSEEVHNSSGSEKKKPYNVVISFLPFAIKQPTISETINRHAQSFLLKSQFSSCLVLLEVKIYVEFYEHREPPHFSRLELYVY